MPLVEVVRGPQSRPARWWPKRPRLAARIGKTLVLVGDCAGFLVNRILAPYMNEAGHLVAEVEDPLEIDRAAVEFGMPMGPLALIDLVGLGVSSHVSENLRAAYGERMEPAPHLASAAAIDRRVESRRHESHRKDLVRRSG